ncbi:hypothetical protein, partial [Bacteroides uniformis]|uniref:hypothetical protein n=1 Tax=Bacteroides uniformis TaxID=820 RepID=UPI001AA1C08E
LRRGRCGQQRSCIRPCAENRPSGSCAGVPHTVFPELVALEYIQGLTFPESTEHRSRNGPVGRLPGPAA